MKKTTRFRVDSSLIIQNNISCFKHPGGMCGGEVCMTHLGGGGSEYKRLSVVGTENIESTRYTFRQIECSQFTKRPWCQPKDSVFCKGVF